tara:strand:- start:1780 stop:2124 length:345 start_codon:yes stop_codon:yes gene_type:complete
MGFFVEHLTTEYLREGQDSPDSFYKNTELMDILHSLSFHGVIKISFKPPYLNTVVLSQTVLHVPNLPDLTSKKEIRTTSIIYHLNSSFMEISDFRECQLRENMESTVCEVSSAP